MCEIMCLVAREFNTTPTNEISHKQIFIMIRGGLMSLEGTNFLLSYFPIEKYFIILTFLFMQLVSITMGHNYPISNVNLTIMKLKAH